MSNKLLLTINEWQKLFIELSFDEGRRLTVYKDSKGIPTVGIGFNLRANKTFRLLEEEFRKLVSRLLIKNVINYFNGLLKMWR